MAKQPQRPGPLLMGVTPTAKALGVSTETVRNYLARGVLTGVQPKGRGTKYLVHVSSVRKLIQGEQER